MAGHSHSKNVANKKGAMDMKKAKNFMKIAKIISVAVKEGGSSNPDFNPKLRLALKMAQNANVPKDIIKRAIEDKSNSNIKLETVLFEGYLDGVAIIALANTDNKNKTTPEIRYIFNKANGILAEPNSVSYMFDKISKIECNVSKKEEEDFLLDAASIGALNVDGNIAKFSPDMHHQAQIELEKSWPIIFAEITYEPNTCASRGNLEAVEKLLENLEKNEYIESCWHNCCLSTLEEKEDF